MRKLLVGLLTLALAFCLGACPKQSAAPATQSSHMLDIILGGPFVFMRQSNCLNGKDCLKIWIPAVPSHSNPILFGLQGQLYQFESPKTDYTLIGMTPAQNWTPLHPVVGSDVWTINGKTFHASAIPKKDLYLSLSLPIPKEIAPWNADPMTPKITSPVPNTPEQHSLATMTILRYDYDDSQILQLTAPASKKSDGVDISFKPLAVGNERVVLIEVIPKQPRYGEDDHIHSHEAAQEAFATLGLKGDVDFPPLPTGYTRNVPLTQGVLPDDLVNFINSLVIINKGRINDCKAMAIFVDPAP